MSIDDHTPPHDVGAIVKLVGAILLPIVGAMLLTIVGARSPLTLIGDVCLALSRTLVRLKPDTTYE